MRPNPERILDFREYPVLYVDDEVENLRTFELGFRREFSIVSAESGARALEILNRRPIAVVLSDQRMPGMTGVELLARVREIDPRVMRILVTAYGDAETLGRAVNDGSIYRYVAKPWTPEEMGLALRRAIEVYALDREREDLLRELAILNRVSQTVNQQIEIEPLLELVLSTVTGELGFDGATLLFLDASGDRLSVSHTVPGDTEITAWLRDFSIAKESAPEFIECLRKGETQLLPLDSALDQPRALRTWLTELAAAELLVVPLIGKRGTIGALALDNRRGRRGFDVPDRTLLQGVAAQATIAIENAHLVDDLRSSREQVIRADRLGTLGTLAAGLAHEINNPLVSIHTFLSLAPGKRDQEDPEFWRDYHELACGEVERIRGLVASMERLARGSALDASPEQSDPRAIAEAVARLLAREADRAQVALEVVADPDTPKIVAVRDHIHQVLLNLLLNAIHASPPGARVELRVEPDDRGGEGSVAIEVADSGPGIAPDLLERVFDPFFTTKDPDQGTGLGLTICQQLVAGHGGSIEVRSREGEGATFRVRLPPTPCRG